MSIITSPDSRHKLLEYLDTHQPEGEVIWNGTAIKKVSGGYNNLVYRVQNGEADIAVKFTIKDKRHRARREFYALQILAEAGLKVSPQALWLDEENYTLPVVVQSWESARPFDAPPKSRLDWEAFLSHYSIIHSLKQESSNSKVTDAVINFRNGLHGKEFVLEAVGPLPVEARPAGLKHLLNWFEDWRPPAFPEAPSAFCRVDPNWRNFIRQGEKIISVDWENSGWGDPAFEIADMMCHPEYEHTTPEDWAFIIQTYASLTGDPDCHLRIMTYQLELQLWWVIRWARFLYEVPRGLDDRLVERPDNWQMETEKRLSDSIEKLHAYIETL